VVDVLDCFPEKLLYVDGGLLDAGGSEAVAVVGTLQENNRGGYERIRNREGKIKDQETAAFAPGVDEKPADNGGSSGAPACDWDGRAASPMWGSEGKTPGGVAEERGFD
jgi:hypothetical protein